jgi:hypothetical protein
MGDIRSGMDLADWVTAAVAGVVCGFGTMMAYFKGSKRVIHERIDEVGEQIEKQAERCGSHGIQMERIKTCQENVTAQLVQLQREQAITNKKLDNLKDFLLRDRGGRRGGGDDDGGADE